MIHHSKCPASAREKRATQLDPATRKLHYAWQEIGGWDRIQRKKNMVYGSNGNASETKANESFDNGVFFDIEAKRTPSLISKLFSKWSEHNR